MTTAFDHDVTIVGGGPAGSSTALHLVRAQGIRADRVLLVDKATFPRDKPCGGAVSQHGVDALAAIGMQVTVPFVPMRGVRVIAEGGVGETPCAMGIVVRRTEFDTELLAAARSDGTVVREGEGLRSITRIAGGFRLDTSAGTLTTRLLAACDGVASTTRKLLGLREPARKGHLYVLDTEPLPADSGTARGLIDFDLTIVDEGLEGYYWDFPTIIGGTPHVSRGIYHVNRERAPGGKGSDVKGALGRALARRGIDMKTVSLRPFSTRPFVPESDLGLDRVVLVGEAAGIDHTTGEGIAQAIVMGAIAARHLSRALRTGSASFDAYGRDVRTSTIGRHMLQSAWLARRVYGRFGRPARRLLLRSSFARDAAMRWYRGESLSWSTEMQLALALASNVRPPASLRAFLRGRTAS